MKAVLLEVSPEELARRKRIGLDRWDEMWEGVLHMAPAPAYEYQRIVAKLLNCLTTVLEKRRKGTIVPGINVFSEASHEEDYRIPDLTFVASGREKIIAADGIRGGGPDVVVEVRSPGDESYDKLPFFARLGVREVVVVSRDTKAPEVFRLSGSQYLAVAADRDAWVTSEALGVRFGRTEEPRLVIEDLADPSLRTEI